MVGDGNTERCLGIIAGDDGGGSGDKIFHDSLAVTGGAGAERQGAKLFFAVDGLTLTVKVTLLDNHGQRIIVDGFDGELVELVVGGGVKRKGDRGNRGDEGR